MPHVYPTNTLQIFESMIPTTYPHLEKRENKMPYIIEGNVPKLTSEEIIRKVADEAGFGDEILVLDLFGGCGVTSQVTGNLWRVFEPASGGAFIICLAENIFINDVEALGLDPSTPFSCYESALNDDTREFVLSQTELDFILPVCP